MWGLTSQQQLRSYGDQASLYTLIQQTGEARDRTCDTWFRKRDISTAPGKLLLGPNYFFLSRTPNDILNLYLQVTAISTKMVHPLHHVNSLSNSQTARPVFAVYEYNFDVDLIFFYVPVCKTFLPQRTCMSEVQVVNYGRWAVEN